MKNIRSLLVIFLALAVTLAGCSGSASTTGNPLSTLTGSTSSSSSGPLTASGTVETTQIPVAAESSGRILSIKVQEGDTVKAGDVLFTLDNVLLQAQRAATSASLDSANAGVATSKAALASAQEQYDIAFKTAMNKVRNARTQPWFQGTPSNMTLPAWYFTQDETITAAQGAVDITQTALQKAQNHQTSVEAAAASKDFVTAESGLAGAQASYDIANALYNKVRYGKNIDEMTRRQVYLALKDAHLNSKGLDNRWTSQIIALDLHDAAQTIYDDAKSALKDAQTAYDDAISTDAAKDVLKARAQSSIALEHYYVAMDYLSSKQTGAASDPVTIAKLTLDQSKAAETQSENAVKLAQANLDLLDAQMAKIAVTAPVDGVVLTRAGEPGSVVNPGGTVLTLGRLDQLTITVYIPETRIGEVVVGESATVKVDSFAGQTFSAVVNYIATQAEFTPRNVQTVDGRSNTVYAVKLQLADTSGKLKPGMPADVTFTPGK